MKKTTFSLLLLLVCAGSLMTSCQNRKSETWTKPTAFRASTGLAQYENEAYRWVQTTCGPIELNRAWIEEGVMTDKGVTADCSNIGSIYCGGKVWIRDSIVRGNSQICNVLRAYNTHFKGPLYVECELIGQQSHFENAVTVNGDVTAENSCFNGLLTATAEIVKLTGSSAVNIYINPTGPYYDPQVIYLKNGSVIKGDVYFLSSRGKIVVDSTSRVDGCIYGGNIIQPFEVYQDLYYNP